MIQQAHTTAHTHACAAPLTAARLLGVLPRFLVIKNVLRLLGIQLGSAADLFVLNTNRKMGVAQRRGGGGVEGVECGQVPARVAQSAAAQRRCSLLWALPRRALLCAWRTFLQNEAGGGRLPLTPPPPASLPPNGSHRVFDVEHVGTGLTEVPQA